MADGLDAIRTVDGHQAAKYLGIPYARLLRLARQGVIPCIRLGRSVRFRVARLQAWLEEQERQQQQRRDAA